MKFGEVWQPGGWGCFTLVGTRAPTVALPNWLCDLGKSLKLLGLTQGLNSMRMQIQCLPPRKITHATPVFFLSPSALLFQPRDRRALGNQHGSDRLQSGFNLT